MIKKINESFDRRLKEFKAESNLILESLHQLNLDEEKLESEKEAKIDTLEDVNESLNENIDGKLILTPIQKEFALDELMQDEELHEYYKNKLDKEWYITYDKTLDPVRDFSDDVTFPAVLVVDGEFADSLGDEFAAHVLSLTEDYNKQKEEVEIEFPVNLRKEDIEEIKELGKKYNAVPTHISKARGGEQFPLNLFFKARAIDIYNFLSEVCKREGSFWMDSFEEFLDEIRGIYPKLDKLKEDIEEVDLEDTPEWKAFGEDIAKRLVEKNSEVWPSLEDAKMEVFVTDNGIWNFLECLESNLGEWKKFFESPDKEEVVELYSSWLNELRDYNLGDREEVSSKMDEVIGRIYEILDKYITAIPMDESLKEEAEAFDLIKEITEDPDAVRYISHEGKECYRIFAPYEWYEMMCQKAGLEPKWVEDFKCEARGNGFDFDWVEEDVILALDK